MAPVNLLQLILCEPISAVPAGLSDSQCSNVPEVMIYASLLWHRTLGNQPRSQCSTAHLKQRTFLNSQMLRAMGLLNHSMVIAINCHRNAKAKMWNNHFLLKSCCSKNCLTGCPDPNFQQTTLPGFAQKGRGGMGNPRATSDGHQWGCTKEQTLSCLSPCLQASHQGLNQSFSTIFAKLLYIKQASDRDDRAKAALAFAIIGRILQNTAQSTQLSASLMKPGVTCQTETALELFKKIKKKIRASQNFLFYKV